MGAERTGGAGAGRVVGEVRWMWIASDDGEGLPIASVGWWSDPDKAKADAVDAILDGDMEGAQWEEVWTGDAFCLQPAGDAPRLVVCHVPGF